MRKIPAQSHDERLVFSAGITEQQASEITRQLAPFAHPRRLWIICFLQKNGGSVSVEDIVASQDGDAPIVEATMSHHLRTLREMGFITFSQTKNTRFYAINWERVTPLQQTILDQL